VSDLVDPRRTCWCRPDKYYCVFILLVILISSAESAAIGINKLMMINYYAFLVFLWALYSRERDNDNEKLYTYMCITTNQPDTESNPNPNPNPDPATKQHEVVSIQLNIEKLIRDNDITPLLLLTNYD